MSGRRTVTRDVPGLTALLTEQAGLARRSQLLSLGITDRHVAAHVAAGRWRMVAPEVVSADNGRLDAEQQRWRALLHAPVGLIGGRSALEVAGLTGYPPELVHLMVPMDNRPRPLSGVRIHVTRRWPAPTAEPDGTVGCCSVPRATVDAAAWESHPRRAAGLVLSVVQQRLTPSEDIADELAAAGRIRHRAVIRDALVEAGAGAESLAEIDVVPLLRRAGLPAPTRQAVIAGRRRDLAVALADGRMLVLEIDGVHHDGPESRWADADRDAALVAADVPILRIPAYAVRHDAGRVVARLRAIDDAARLRARQSLRTG
jgi:very-short-patch-repair endonuclease